MDEIADEVQRQAQDTEQQMPTGRENGPDTREVTAPVEDAPVEDGPGTDEGTPSPEPTGHSEVDEVLASLASLGTLPVAEHARVFEAAHDRLRSALADAGDDRPA